MFPGIQPSYIDDQAHSQIPTFPISPTDRETLDNVLLRNGSTLGAAKLSLDEEADKIRKITEFRENRKLMRSQLQKMPTPSSPTFNLSHQVSNIPPMPPVTNFFFHQEPPKQATRTLELE